MRLPEVNRVIMSGRLTRDPELRYAPDGTPIAGFTLAFHRRYRAREGGFEEQTGFVSVKSYQRLAEVCGKYLKQGSPVLVEGRLQMREWTTAQGRKSQRLEIRADQVHFLEQGSRPADAGPGADA